MTEGPCGKFELCLLYNNIINAAKAQSYTHSEFLKYSAEKSFCLKILPDNLKILFDVRKVKLIYSLLQVAQEAFPVSINWDQ